MSSRVFFGTYTQDTRDCEESRRISLDRDLRELKIRFGFAGYQDLRQRVLDVQEENKAAIADLDLKLEAAQTLPSRALGERALLYRILAAASPALEGHQEYADAWSDLSLHCHSGLLRREGDESFSLRFPKLHEIGLSLEGTLETSAVQGLDGMHYMAGELRISLQYRDNRVPRGVRTLSTDDIHQQALDAILLGSFAGFNGRDQALVDLFQDRLADRQYNPDSYFGPTFTTRGAIPGRSLFTQLTIERQGVFAAATIKRTRAPVAYADGTRSVVSQTGACADLNRVTYRVISTPDVNAISNILRRETGWEEQQRRYQEAVAEIGESGLKQGTADAPTRKTNRSKRSKYRSSGHFYYGRPLI